MNKHKTALRLIAIIGLVAGTVLSFVGAFGYASVEGATGDLDPLAMDGVTALAALGTSLFAIGVLALVTWLHAGSVAADLRGPAAGNPDLRAAGVPRAVLPPTAVPVGLPTTDLRAADGGAAY